MVRPGFCVLVALLAVAVLTLPASATLILSAPTLNPSAVPLSPGTQQSVNATLTIIPSGDTTFNSQHSVQITTDLNQPTWYVQVFKNGIGAAVIPTLGNAVFINGYLLSYPSNNDVSVVIGVSGSTPSTPGSNVTLLQVEEIDNTNTVVPGSVSRVTEPVAGSVATTTASIPVNTPESASVPVSPTRQSPGFSSILGTTAICIGGIILIMTFKRGA